MAGNHSRHATLPVSRATGYDRSVPSGRRKPLGVLVLGACIIGLAPILVRFGDAGASAVAFWRLLFALPILALVTRRSSEGPGVPSRAALLAGLAFALDLGFWHYGITLTSVAKATVLANLTPVVVTGISWVLLGYRPSRTFLLAVILAVSGAWIMAAARPAGPVGPNPLVGDILSLTTALWYALYFLAVSAARRTDSASRVMLWSSAAGAPLLLAAAAFLGETILPTTTGGWLACVALGLVHVSGQGAIAWSLGRLPPATASVTVLVQPVVAAMLGWVIFGEIFSRVQTAGAAIALSGVVIAQLASGATSDASKL